jgi:hypothetical protein
MQEAIPNRKLSTLIWMLLCIGRANQPLLRGKPIAVGGSENRGVLLPQVMRQGIWSSKCN